MGVVYTVVVIYLLAYTIGSIMLSFASSHGPGLAGAVFTHFAHLHCIGLTVLPAVPPFGLGS